MATQENEISPVSPENWQILLKVAKSIARKYYPPNEERFQESVHAGLTIAEEIIEGWDPERPLEPFAFLPMRKRIFKETRSRHLIPLSEYLVEEMRHSRTDEATIFNLVGELAQPDADIESVLKQIEDRMEQQEQLARLPKHKLDLEDLPLVSDLTADSPTSLQDEDLLERVQKIPQTAQEHAILKAILNGTSNRTLAKELGTTHPTIRAPKESLLNKIRAQLGDSFDFEDQSWHKGELARDHKTPRT